MNVQPLPTAGATFGSRLLHTPLFDLLRGRLTGSLDLRRVIAAAALPRPLADLIRRVARRTRLWRIERVDVARELAEHFRDGLAAGRTAEQLVESFGDPRQAARLIRRAKLRARPLFWRVWRRSVQTLAAVAALTIACFLFRLARYFTSHPTITHNYGDDLVAGTQGIAEADHAWPFYRKAMLRITKTPLITEMEDAMDDGSAASDGTEPKEPPVPKVVGLDVTAEKPGSKHWDKVGKRLDENQAALETARQGAARSHFGFVFGDPADSDWLKSRQISRPETMDPRKSEEGAGSVIIEQLPAVMEIWELWNADARRGLEENGRQAFLDDVRAILGLAEQLRGDLPLLYFDHMSRFYFQDALILIDEALAEHSGLLDDDDLRDLAHRIAGYAGGGPIGLRLEGARLSLLDIIQRCYSDDGGGDGTLTREGIKLWQDWQDATYRPDFDPTDPAIGAAVAALGPSRRTMTQLISEYSDRAEQQFHRPLWQWTRSNFSHDVDRRQDSALDRIYYAPLLIFREIPRQYYSSELATQERDATLVALALELYHRRHDSWPEHLDELVPDLLPAVPPDRFTGQPLGYRVVDGRPLLYSVGADGMDDGGEAIKDPLAIFRLASPGAETYPAGSIPPGDWILWPPQTKSPRITKE